MTMQTEREYAEAMFAIASECGECEEYLGALTDIRKILSEAPEYIEFLASPAIALYIIDLLREQGLTLTEKADYQPTRRSMHHFRDASIEEKNEMIKKNASYGKIVCRCERVTEGEILDALRINPKARDLDGVKRRTRSQMGRCQGGFCTPYITELIAKELDIPFEGVTKFGGSSIINVEKTKGGR